MFVVDQYQAGRSGAAPFPDDAIEIVMRGTGSEAFHDEPTVAIGDESAHECLGSCLAHELHLVAPCRICERAVIHAERLQGLLLPGSRRHV